MSSAASANSAPPDYRVEVKVINGPEELYYLDLLKQPDGGRLGPAPEELDQELLEAMEQAEPEGWLACTLSGMGDHFMGDMAGENGVHVFHGMETPKVFRILIVTKSGESWVSEPLERKVFQSAVTVDWEKGTAKMSPVWVAFGTQLLATLLPTLMIEGLALLAFGLSSKRNWLVFLVVNLITQGALSAFLASNLIQRDFFYVMSFALLIMIPVELLIAVVEANIYKHQFQGCSRRRAFWYGITANAASYALGWAAVELVFHGLISL
ncbi:MAG: hypothetical protein K2O45_13905 [Oscillospiraceae bacterium]|nr:hypothetical protein [Oscillospiraceae bacterium]